jgi:phosphoglycerate dehydrogenase-like enzyme
MISENRNLLKIRNLHTYFFLDEGVVRAVDGIDLDLREGETLGIVGLGHVGMRVAALGKGFEMKMLSFTRHGSKDKTAGRAVKFVGLNTLLKESDSRVHMHIIFS